MRSFLLLVPLLAGCASTEITLLLGSRRVLGETEHSGLAAELTVTQSIGKRAVCSASHTSDPTKGNPVNDAFDVSVDFAGCGVRWGGER